MFGMPCDCRPHSRWIRRYRLIPALQRAQLFDPASEDLARSLMRAHLRSGQTSEAIGFIDGS